MVPHHDRAHHRVTPTGRGVRQSGLAGHDLLQRSQLKLPHSWPKPEATDRYCAQTRFPLAEVEAWER